jgi:hypothetical protein
MSSYHDQSYLCTLKKKDLQDILRQQQKTISGNKPELIARILSSYVAAAAAASSENYSFVRGSDAFENLMSCFEEWCEKRDYELFKQTTSVCFEKVSKNEFRHSMAGVETPMDFLDRFWVCWMNKSWGMYDKKDEEEFQDDVFMCEFQQSYAKKLAMMLSMPIQNCGGCCSGCNEGQSNQLAHMDKNGCLYTELEFDSVSE